MKMHKGASMLVINSRYVLDLINKYFILYIRFLIDQKVY